MDLICSLFGFVSVLEEKGGFRQWISYPSLLVKVKLVKVRGMSEKKR